tara:strand:+ start:267 stop:554 length:288 start_codon:yes stop_codon:yes gene_type:complete
MKIYTKIILDKNYNILEESYFEYNGPLSNCGIHYDFKSTRSAKLMEKQAKREKKLAERKAKRLAKEGVKKSENKKPELDPNKPISLDFLTNPNKE